MQKIGIVYHPKVEATRAKALEIQSFLKGKGMAMWVCSAWDKEKTVAGLPGTDLLITVGGDGTILRAAQCVLTDKTPILGINMGKLGFMTELTGEEILEKLPQILGDKGWIDERAMLKAELAAVEGKSRVYHALNDCVIARGEIARLIRVEATIDGQRLATYKADAVIAATATGSTGYALAAGGPVVFPQSPDILLTAVAPHLSFPHPLVLPGTTVITLQVSSYLPSTLCLDGHINLPLKDNDTVTVSRSNYSVRFIRVRPREYFYTSLEARLKGK